MAQVLFSSNVLKLSSKGKQDERVLVVTDKNIYKLDRKTFKVHSLPTIIHPVMQWLIPFISSACNSIAHIHVFYAART